MRTKCSFRILSPIHQTNREASLHLDAVLADLDVNPSSIFAIRQSRSIASLERRVVWKRPQNYAVSGGHPMMKSCTRRCVRVLVSGQTGAFMDVFVPNSSGPLAGPFGLAFGNDGNLYVSNQQAHQVLRYNGQTGAFIGVFVAL